MMTANMTWASPTILRTTTNTTDLNQVVSMYLTQQVGPLTTWTQDACGIDRFSFCSMTEIPVARNVGAFKLQLE